MFPFFRNTLEFYPDEFTIKNPKFGRTLESILYRVKDELCISCDPNVALQKLVICGKGSQYEPSPGEGEFATLIVQLPSLFTGNNLTIRHGNETKTIEFDRKESQCEILYSAFYPNCKYEMTPIEFGYRTFLVYRLMKNDSTEPIKHFKESTQRKQDIASSLSKVCFNFQSYYKSSWI